MEKLGLHQLIDNNTSPVIFESFCFLTGSKPSTQSSEIERHISLLCVFQFGLALLSEVNTDLQHRAVSLGTGKAGLISRLKQKSTREILCAIAR